MSDFTIGIIGLGGRISGVANNIMDQDQRFRLVGYADPTPFGADRLRHEHAAQAFTDAEEMVSTLKPDAILIGSPNHLHLEHLEIALGSGAKVFCEKPVVLNEDETWRAAELLREHGQERFLVGLVLRSAWLFETVMEQIANGTIGDIISMEANELLFPDHGAFLMRDWRRLRKYVGSYILEKCCHDIDLYQALCGSRIRRIASFGGRNIFTAEHRDLEQHPEAERYGRWREGWSSGPKTMLCDSDGDVLDHQLAAMECENGARISFHSNTHSAWHQRRWVICGHRGTIECDLATTSGRIQAVFGEEQAFTPPESSSAASHYGADQRMAAAVKASWLEGAEFPVPTRAALEAGLAAMGMDRAQRSGQIVDLSDTWQRFDAIINPIGSPV